MFLENENQSTVVVSHSPYDLARPVQDHQHQHLQHHNNNYHANQQSAATAGDLLLMHHHNHLHHHHHQDDSEGGSSASSPTSSYRDLSGCEDFDMKMPKPSSGGGGTGSVTGSTVGGGNNCNNNNNNNNKEQKPKKHKCKHCGLECTEKVHYWKHIRTHIKPEQLLECPNCEFATDLKHHYEYHLLNHTGAKPFTCPDCDYKCVSKSMLQSHLKSHSNVFQFQCYDCGYASKYMHSLKQHLKKRDHRPATPLNPDGTPNPDIVIDVVGNRRGPRQNKKQNRHNPYRQHHHHQQQQQQQQQLIKDEPLVPSQHHQPQEDGGPLSSPYSMQQLLQLPTSVTAASAAYPTSAESFMYSMITKRTIDIVDYHAEYMAIKNNNNNSTAIDDKMDVHQQYQQQQQQQQQQQNHHHHHQYHAEDLVKVEMDVGETPEPSAAPAVEPVVTTATATAAATTTTAASSSITTPAAAIVEMGPLNLSRDSATVVVPRAVGSSRRRKGIACKLERPVVTAAVEPPKIAVSADCSSTESSTKPTADVPMVPTPPPLPLHQCPVANVKEEQPLNVVQQQQQQQQHHQPSSSPEKDDETHVCHHCDIIFKENIMYSMHMGFHSFRDPFACNLCGEITTDKFSFFAHIARVPHS